MAILALAILVVSASVSLSVTQPVARAQSAAQSTPLLSDDFTQDANLSSTLWQINGTVGFALGQDDVGLPQTVMLAPTFSSAGMEIAQVNTSFEVGTIQSVESFAPPFTATAEVEGVISNGHTFGFAVASTNASSGVLVYGNLNSTNCSHLINCGDPSVCGASANPSIPANQCYYGIDAKIGQGGAHWKHVGKMNLTPSVNVIYTVQISVDASGTAQYSISQGGRLLNESVVQVGTGPFYIVLEQAEGAPVARPGPNQALWLSVSVTPTSSTFSTTSASPAPSPSGIPVIELVIIVIVIVVILLIILLWYRRRNLTVTVQDSSSSKPIPEAVASADGPEQLSGYTGNDGKVTFKGVKKGDYMIGAKAKGYDPSVPVKVSVKKTAEYAVRLDRNASAFQETTGSNLPPEGPRTSLTTEGTASAREAAAELSPAHQGQQSQGPVAEPVQPGTSPAVGRPPPPPSTAGQESLELEGWGGDRIGKIIKTFQMKGAISPETALTAEELGLSRLFVRIMKRRKGRTRVFVEINGRYYLNEKALQETQ